MRLPSLAACLAVLCCAATAGAATYYVDYEAGDDTRAGTSRGAAWQHAPGDSAATGAAKAVKLQPGDVIQFKGGVVYRGTLTLTASGVRGKPIVYDGNAAGDWGKGKAIIEGSVPLKDLKRCADAAEALGNPHYKHIYRTTVPKGAKWNMLNVCQGLTPVAWSQAPNPADPVFQENPREYYQTDPHTPQTRSTIKVEALGGIGENSGRPLISMFDGTSHSAVIQEMTRGAEVKVTVPEPVTVVALSVSPQRRYVSPRQMSFVADGKEILRTELEHHPDKTVEQRFELPGPATFKTLVIRFHSAYQVPGRNARSYGAVQRIAGYNAEGENVLVTRRVSTLRHDKAFTQDDPRYYDGALLALYGSPNRVYYKRITGYDPSTHTIRFETLRYNEKPYSKGGAFAIVNNPRAIDMPGEYALVPGPEADGPDTLLVWPPDGTPENLTRGQYGNGIDCQASFVTVQGFWVRKQGWGGARGIRARVVGGGDVTIRDCKVTNLRGNGIGIYAGRMDYVLVDRCEVSNNAGHVKGILLRDGSHLVTRRCILHRNSSTALDYYTVTNGVVQNCLVTENRGMHANGLTFYVGCRNVLIEGNVVRGGNVGLTLQDGQNMIIRNNIIEGGLDGEPAIGLWAGKPYDNIVITNNVFRYHGSGGTDSTVGIYGGSRGSTGYAIVNNILDGISGNVLLKADLHHNLFTRYGPTMTEKRLGDNRLVADLDTLFVDAANHDYRPAPGSPAIDAGVVLTTLNAYDIEGTPRPQGKAVDIGPYEATPGRQAPDAEPRLIDPRSFEFSFAGYEIAPPPELKIVYEMRFPRREGAETIVLKGTDLTGEGGGKVNRRVSQGGYVSAWYKPGHWLEWTVDVPEAGAYELAIDHGSETTARRRLLLNGEPVEGLEAVHFPPTGDWSVFAKSGLEEPLMLRKGRNTVRFEQVEGHLNFKRLEFIPVVVK